MTRRPGGGGMSPAKVQAKGRVRRNEPDCWRTGKKAGRRAGAKSRREVRAAGGLQTPDPHGGSL